MKKFLVTMLFVLLAVTLFAAGQSESVGTPEEPIVLRFADIHPANNPTGKADIAFAEAIERNSNGRIKVELYLGGQLGDEKEYIEQIQMGSLDLCRVSAAPMGQFNEQMNVYTFPYLFKDADHFWEVLSGQIGRELFRGLEKAGVYGFAYFDAGTRDFFTNKPINSLADLQGLKIRSMQNEICIAGINALGASAVPMGYSEQYSATKTGVVNGAENNPPSYLATSMYEVAPYYIHDMHVRIPDIVIGSKIALDKLSAEDLQAIVDAGVEAEKIQRELWDQSVADAIEELEKLGTTFYTPTEKDLADFRAAVQPVYEKYGAKYQDIINRIRALEN